MWTHRFLLGAALLAGCSSEQSSGASGASGSGASGSAGTGGSAQFDAGWDGHCTGYAMVDMQCNAKSLCRDPWTLEKCNNSTDCEEAAHTPCCSGTVCRGSLGIEVCPTGTICVENGSGISGTAECVSMEDGGFDATPPDGGWLAADAGSGCCGICL